MQDVPRSIHTLSITSLNKPSSINNIKSSHNNPSNSNTPTKERNGNKSLAW